ncbi:MAG TPA: alpha/beta fold hydrolase [Burkholderiaceae bacterium]|nr:alpha/beta fold hydrolase [Burkholderiaceae bacterium]
MVEKTITRPDGARLRIRDHADSAPAGAPAIVLSNSLATDLSLWDAVVGPLSARWRVVAYDTRGHGASHAPAPAATFGDLAGDLLAVMDAAGLGAAFVAGVSLGGMAGLHCARDAPARVRGLVACNCRASIDAAGIAGWEQRVQVLRERGLDALAGVTLERWFEAGYRTANPAVMDRVRTMIRATSPAGYEACVRAIESIDLLGRLPGIRVPVLLVAGAQDGAASPATMRGMADAIPDARLEVLDPCGHLSPVQRPAELTALIDGFLTRWSAPR